MRQNDKDKKTFHNNPEAPGPEVSVYAEAEDPSIYHEVDYKNDKEVVNNELYGRAWGHSWTKSVPGYTQDIEASRTNVFSKQWNIQLLIFTVQRYASAYAADESYHGNNSQIVSVQAAYRLPKILIYCGSL